MGRGAYCALGVPEDALKGVLRLNKAQVLFIPLLENWSDD